MMRTVKCPECGTPSSINLKSATADVWCPACLAGFAQDESEKLKSAAPSKSRALPPELTGKDQLGKFVLAEKLGVGGSGEVWKAWDTALGRWVALKIFHEEDPKDLARFTREAETAAKLSHPHIASIYEVGQHKGRHFLAMQYVEGVTLLKHPRRDRKLLVRLIRDAARAVGEAHRQGIVHRDLKPANLAVASHASKPHVYVLDFGLARRIEGGEKLTATGIVVGTPAYLPPEQARGEKVDGRADVYALGATLYHVLTGRPPFKGPNVFEVLRKVQDREPIQPRKLVSTLERDLQTITLKALEKDPARRYASAEAFADDLDRWLDGDPIQAKPPTILHRLQRAGARRKLTWTVSALTLVLALIGTWWFASGKPERDYLRHFEAGMRSWEDMRTLAFGKVHHDKLQAKAAETRGHFDRALQARESGQAHAMRGRCLEYEGNMVEARRSSERAYAMIRNPETAFLLARHTLLAYRFGVTSLTNISAIWHCYPEDGWECYFHFEPPSGAPDVDLSVFRECEKLVSSGGSSEAVHLLQGLRAIASSRLEEGSQLLLKHVEQDPLDFVILDIASRCFELAGRHDLAESTQIRFLNLVRHPGALLRLADLQMDLQKWPESEKTCDGLLELMPDYHDARVMRAQVRAFRGRPEEAIADCSAVLSKRPHSLNALFYRGVACAELGKLDEAIADMTRVIELDPTNSPAHSNRAMYYARQGVLERAWADADTAVNFKPGLPIPHYSRAQVRLKLRDHSGAIEDCTQALKLGMRFGPVLLCRAEAYEALGNMESALRDYDEAIALNPKRALYRREKGIRLFRVGKEDEAFESLSEAVALNPKFSEAFWVRGRLFANVGRLAEAIKDMSHAIELNPNPDFYCSLGAALDATRERAKALQALNKAEQLGHTCPALFINRARSKRALGDHPGAEADFSTGITGDPADGGNHYERGEFRLERGDVDSALEDFRTAYRLIFISLAENPKPSLDLTHRAQVTSQLDALNRTCVRLQTLKEYELAMRGFLRVFEGETGGTLRSTAAYNISCTHAVMGNKSNALDWLERAVSIGWDDAIHIELDKDFASIRDDERFKVLLARLKASKNHKDD